MPTTRGWGLRIIPRRCFESSWPVQIEIELPDFKRGNGGRTVSYFTFRISIILMETIKDLYISRRCGASGERRRYRPGQLRLTGSVLVDLYLGKITKER